MTPKKKIAVFIDWYLPGYKAGGPIRSCANLVEHLKGIYDFYIITRDTDYCETTPYPNVRSDCWNQREDGTRVYYISEKNLSRATLKKIITDMDFDVAYINGIYSYFFSIVPLRLLKKTGKPVVIASRGMLAKSAIKVKGIKKRIFLFLAKFFRLYQHVLFHATNPMEVEDINRELGHVAVHLAPNLPRKVDITTSNNRSKLPGKLRLVNIARIAPEKNLKYALEILKELSVSNSSMQIGDFQIQFDIYGPVYDKSYWNECEVVIREIKDHVSINYGGSIESNLISEKLADYHFLFMPTKGENFGHIILESLAVGCPVIISDQTPWRELKKRSSGWDLPLSHQEEFLERVKECVLMGQEEYDRLVSGARKQATEYIINNQIISQNIELFRKH